MLANSKIMVPSTKLGLSMCRGSEIGNGLCHQAMLFNQKAFCDKRYRFTRYRYSAELDYYIDSIISGGYLVDEEFLVAYDNREGISQSRADLHFREMLKIYRDRGLTISMPRKARGYVRSYLISRAQQFSRKPQGR
jgi:hypothetical protein